MDVSEYERLLRRVCERAPTAEPGPDVTNLALLREAERRGDPWGEILSRLATDEPNVRHWERIRMLFDRAHEAGSEPSAHSLAWVQHVLAARWPGFRRGRPTPG